MKKQKGSVLVFSLIVLSFILLTSFSLAAISLIERRSANSSVAASTAFQNSDKGVEEFLQRVYKDLDPNETLVKLKENLNVIYGSGVYVCKDGDEGLGVPARIGNLEGEDGRAETEFIITAYEESSTPGGDEWSTALTPAYSCDTALADISRFKVAGNYKRSARAVFLKMRDSLTRGLVAHWSFEDRAFRARHIDETGGNDGNADRVAYIARDKSKQNHTLTLCKLKTDESGDDDLIDVDIYYGEESEKKNIVSFDGCDPDSDDGMNPKRGYFDTTMEQTEDDDEYEKNDAGTGGSWMPGIVSELIDVDTADIALGDMSSTEALDFNGTSDYLASNFKDNCGTDDINCIPNSKDKLNFENEKGISISVWVKIESSITDGILISRMNKDKDKGYELNIEGGKACLHIDDKQSCTDDDVNDGEWRHIVGEWRVDNEIKMFLDGLADGSPTAQADISASGNDLDIVYVGARDNSTDGDGTQDDIGDFFEGTMDDLRIWDRALTPKEVCRICQSADAGNTDISCNALDENCE